MFLIMIAKYCSDLCFFSALMMIVTYCLFFASSFGLFCHFLQNAVSILICSHWAWLLLFVQSSLITFICSHYGWYILFVQIMFKYEFSACPVSHVCDQSCLSSVLRLMINDGQQCCSWCLLRFGHCCLVFSSVVQFCLLCSSVVFNFIQCPVLQLMVDCGFMFNLPLTIALLASHCNLCHKVGKSVKIKFALK